MSCDYILTVEHCTCDSLVPRPTIPPAFDHLCKMEGEGLETYRVICGTADIMILDATAHSRISIAGAT